MSLYRLGENYCGDVALQVRTGCFYRTWSAGMWLVLFLAAVAQVASGQALTPPPWPDVPPTISGTYESDLDGNRIDDELEGGFELATLPSSLYAEARTLGGELASETMVDVELVFDEPVTQEQIDTFLAMGGQISYVYQAVSYGWNGRIARGRVDSLPLAMGPTLVLVTPTARQMHLYMDAASQAGRVRPVWKGGFAGHAQGFKGNSNTTIGFIDTGVDSTHADMDGRCAYWKDVSGEPEPNPVDYNGHGSRVAGVAVGTGQSAGADRSQLRYTYVEDWPYPAHVVDPICLPSGTATMTSQAYWSGPVSRFDLVTWLRGDAEMHGLEWIGNGQEGLSGTSVTNTFYASTQSVYSPLLVNFNEMLLDSVVITTLVRYYPGIGDGFNTFSGVAPGCNYASVKVATRDGAAYQNAFAMGVDALVAQRVSKKVKIINISAGLHDDLGFPIEDASLRDKVMTACRGGVVVIAAAGNSANDEIELLRKMADPARAALAITVGASNDENRLTDYSAYGYINPRDYASEDFKPDLIAPGGDYWYTAVMSIDSGTCDGMSSADRVANDYASGVGTSFSSPFVAGAAGLVIEALERTGVTWDFASDRHPRLVKMLLCATATETNDVRQGRQRNPSLDRNGPGAEGFPAGKDRYEGYGLINADAAVEAAGSIYAPGTTVSVALGGGIADRRAWAATIDLNAGAGIDLSLDVPAAADFDLYLYDRTPSETGTPVVLASSTASQADANEAVSYTPTSDGSALVVVKRISGSGTFVLESMQVGPPVAQNAAVSVGAGSSAMITLTAVDDGSPNPPGQLTYAIVSLPRHGKLERPGGSAITTAPATLAQGGNQVVYRPDSGWTGEDSFTFRADDGGVAPFGGPSNVAKVSISVVNEVELICRVAAGDDDAHANRWSSLQRPGEPSLAIGQYTAGMRFCGVEVPQGAEIIRATLRICAHAEGTCGWIAAALYAEAADNPGSFTSEHRVSALTMTTASQDWSWDSVVWQANAWYESPDIRSVIQEVIDRPGWSPGNALVIAYVVSDSGAYNRRFWAYEGSPSKAAELVIVYRP